MRAHRFGPNFLATGWFAQAARLLRGLTSTLREKTRIATFGLAAEVKGIVPTHEHIYTDSKVNAALAKKVLLDEKMRLPLVQKFKGLHAMLSLCTSLKAKASDSPLDSDGANANEIDVEWEAAKAVLQSAKDALTVIAATEVLYALKSDEAKADAAKLLARPRPELKKALLEALKKV